MGKLRYLLSALLGMAILVLVVSVAYVAAVEQNSNQYSIFSWEDEIIYPEQRSELIDTCKQMNIGIVYQALTKEMLGNEETRDFLNELHQNGMETYYLTGAPEWGLEGRGKSLKKEILLIAEYNERLNEGDARFKGIMVDIEPYLTDKWKTASNKKKQNLFKTYTKGMIEAYKLAHEKGLFMIACIPSFYERYSVYDLEHLTAEGCDGLAVMNYDRSDEIGQIQGEVKIAKKYKKPIIFIAELQKPGYHSLEDINTYYNVGLDALKDSWKSAKDWFQYKGLSFSYHYYLPLKEMLSRGR